MRFDSVYNSLSIADAAEEAVEGRPKSRSNILIPESKLFRQFMNNRKHFVNLLKSWLLNIDMSETFLGQAVYSSKETAIWRYLRQWMAFVENQNLYKFYFLSTNFVFTTVVGLRFTAASDPLAGDQTNQTNAGY